MAEPQQLLDFAAAAEPEIERYPAPEPDAYGTPEPYWADQELPREAWGEGSDGNVWVNGIGPVPGGYRIDRIRYAAQVDGFTCQACKKTHYSRPEVALWRRWENALGRRMYWLGLASGARPRSRCDACEAAHG